MYISRMHHAAANSASLRWLGAASRALLLAASCGVCPATVLASDPPTNRTTVVLVVGAAGEAEYGKVFAEAARRWEEMAGRADARLLQIGLGADQDSPDRDRLRSALEAEPAEGTEPLWVVLIGHGTFDGKLPKFNVRGPDFSAQELAQWLKPIRRPVVVINAASSSGAFLPVLSAPGRVVITATRSGDEQNYARFGAYLAETMADPASDLDKDGQTSLLEGYLFASRRVAEFYSGEGRLATEHALLDDNGDALGTPADWFRGIRAVKKARDG